MTIFVKEEKMITLEEVDGSQSIKYIKDEIHMQSGIHPDEQELVFSDKILEDGRSLQDYNIQTCATLHLLHKRRPGTQ